MEYLDMRWLGASPLILTNWALELIVNQYRKMLGELQSHNPQKHPAALPLPACTGSFRLQYGLPCAHEMLTLYGQDEEILVDIATIHQFWHLEQRLVCIYMLRKLTRILIYMGRTIKIHTFAL